MATATATQREDPMVKVDCSGPRLTSTSEGLLVTFEIGADKGHRVQVHLSPAELAEHLSKALNPPKRDRRVVNE